MRQRHCQVAHMSWRDDACLSLLGEDPVPRARHCPGRSPADGGLDPDGQNQESQAAAGGGVRSTVSRELQPQCGMVQRSAAAYASAGGLGHRTRKALG